MKVSTIKEELNSLAYHGRGIIIGKSADGKKAVTAYFIMLPRCPFSAAFHAACIYDPHPNRASKTGFLRMRQ